MGSGKYDSDSLHMFICDKLHTFIIFYSVSMNVMELQKWIHFAKSTNQLTIAFTEDSLETDQFIKDLSGYRNTMIFLLNPDIDFPPPKKPYRYDKYFRKEELPENYESIDYYEKINTEVIDIIEKNNLHIVTYAASMSHHNIICIPLGVYSQFRQVPIKEKTILCYVNMGMHCDRWYGNPRKDFKAAPFMVQRSNLSMDSFYEDIAKSKFMICPRGCGIDTHRMWDCIMLGCIPIVKRYHGHKGFDDLPILFVDNYDVTEELLNETYEAYSKKTFCYEKCTMEYWIDKVTRHKEIFL